jgi:hypothetical protein
MKYTFRDICGTQRNPWIISGFNKVHFWKYWCIPKKKIELYIFVRNMTSVKMLFHVKKENFYSGMSETLSAWILLQRSDMDTLPI